MKFDKVKSAPDTAQWITVSVGDFLCNHFEQRSTEYQKVLQRVTRPVKKLVEKKLLSPEEDRKYAILAFVEHVIVDWRNVTSNGQPVPYTREMCVELLTQSPETFYDLIEAAADISNYMPDEDTVKNSASA